MNYLPWNREKYRDCRFTSAEQLLLAPRRLSRARAHMGRISGAYKALRDGVVYTYEATWREAGEGVIWNARVRRDNSDVGKPNGQIRTVVGIDLADEVRRLVEKAIEAGPPTKRAS